MTRGQALDRTALDAHPPPALGDGGKDDHGRILVIAGSRDVPGAALLTATAAMRSGAGKLKIVTVESAATALGMAMPEAMVIGLREDDGGGFASGTEKRIAELAPDCDAVVAGPGMQPGEQCGKIAEAVLEAAPALALDAALLHALQPLPEAQRASPPLLLPHAGELAALLDCDVEAIERDPIECGVRAAQLYRSVVLVKGSISHVVTPDEAVWTYDGGARGLGVSGSGDVLAGIVGGLLARGAEPLTALLWSVWLHGEAGARLARKIGEVGFLARELAGEIPALLAS